MYDTRDIPGIPDQGQRLDAVTTDCYHQADELAAMQVYITDAMDFPFAATWRDPDEDGHAEPVTVLGLGDVENRRGVLLLVERGNKERYLLTEQVWADDGDSANAIVLDDYRYWLDELNGLTPGYG